MEADDTDPETRECNHFHPLNTVFPEPLVRMAMGTPAALYNGGMLQAHVRYFDPAGNGPSPSHGLRTGLPEHVAALVDKVSADGAHLTLVNTDPVASHPVLMQAGSFGEHEFTNASVDKGYGAAQQVVVNGKYLKVELGPAAQVTLDLGMKRFVHKPSYDFPPFENA